MAVERRHDQSLHGDTITGIRHEVTHAGDHGIAVTGIGSTGTGTPYQFYTREGSSDNLLIYFNGGGACWFGQGCGPASQPNVHFPFAEMPENNPANGHGVLALDNPENPFRDYDMVSTPNCTGDVHVGYANTSTVLNWAYQNFAAPGKVAEHYSNAPVTLIADAAGGYNSPSLPVIFNAWNPAAILPA